MTGAVPSRQLRLIEPLALFTPSTTTAYCVPALALNRTRLRSLSGALLLSQATGTRVRRLVPVNTPRTVSKLLPMVSIINTPLAAGCKPNHLLAPPITPQMLGSPGCVVAPVVFRICDPTVPAATETNPDTKPAANGLLFLPA